MAQRTGSQAYWAVIEHVVGGDTFVALLNHGQVSTAVVARARRKH
jgi:hypothetical protein